MPPIPPPPLAWSPCVNRYVVSCTLTIKSAPVATSNVTLSLSIKRCSNVLDKNQSKLSLTLNLCLGLRLRLPWLPTTHGMCTWLKCSDSKLMPALIVQSRK